MQNEQRGAAPGVTIGRPAGRQRATSYDVARAAGVAQSTVSRCFQNDSAISPATRALVRETARRLGYVPNALARSLITRRSHIVAVIVTRYTLRGNPDVIYAIGESLAAAGKQLLLVTAEHDLPDPASLRGALEYPLDGLISCVQLTDAEIRGIQERQIALVLYNRASPIIPVDTVMANHATAAAAVAAALHAAGHRRFLCISGPPDAPVSRERIAGFIGRLAALGIPRTPMIETDFSYAGGRDGFLAGVDSCGLPHAVFCANDQTALGVMDACRFTLGLAIPRDISVVGFDDVTEASRPGYGLTTMHQDTVDMARQAVGMLLQRIAAPDRPVTRMEVAARFVVRDSARLELDGSGATAAIKGKPRRERPAGRGPAGP
jgi:DNA-binding LacI/PurR family transcriptional regulator